MQILLVACDRGKKGANFPCNYNGICIVQHIEKAPSKRNLDQLTSIDYLRQPSDKLETCVAREWALHGYKARLDSAIEGERWDEADRVRVAVKRRLLEMISKGGGENDEIAAARDALADSFDRLRLTKRVRIEKGALSTATRLLTDAETAGIAAEQAPLPPDTARDVKERIMQILSSGNRRPWSTGELAKETARRVETVARAVSQLRAERKITSRRIGRYVLHRLAETQVPTFEQLLRTTQNAPVKKWALRLQLSGASTSVINNAVTGNDDTDGIEAVSRAFPEGLKVGAQANSYSSADEFDGEPGIVTNADRNRMAIIEKKFPLVPGNLTRER